MKQLLGLRRTKPRTIITCHCSRETDRPRNGECPPCALRTARGHELGRACAVCELDDQRMLRRHQLEGNYITLCGNHATLAGRRQITLEQLRAEAATAPVRAA